MMGSEPESVARSVDPVEQPDLVMAVVEAVAAARGEPVETLDERVYDAVDPDALTAVIASIDGHVAFTMGGCEVVVQSDGRVVARPRKTIDTQRVPGPASPDRAASSHTTGT